MIGIKIYNDSHSLILYPNTQVKILRKSPFFQDGVEVPTRSYSFSIPANENQDFFKHANLLDIRGGVYVYNVLVDLKGSFSGKALLWVEMFDSVSYNVKVTLGRGASALSLDKSIRSFSFLKETPYRYRVVAGDPTLPYKDYELSFASGLPMTGDPVAIIIEAYSRHLGRQENIVVIYTPPTSLSDYLDAIVEAVNTNTSTHCIKAKRQTSTTIRLWDLAANDHYPDLAFIPQTIDWYGYFNDFSNVASNHPDPVGQEINHANDTINTSGYDYVFYPVYADNLVLSGIDFKKVINHYYPANNSPGPAINGLDGTIPTDWIKENVLQPYPYLWEIISQIFSELKFQIQNDFFDAELKQLTYYIPLFSNLFKDGIIAGLTTRSFKYSSILPDIALGDLLNDLKRLFGMLTIFDSKNDTVWLYSRKQVFESSDIEDWTPYLLHEYTGKRDTTNLYFTTTWPQSELLAQGILSETNRMRRLSTVLDSSSLADDNFNDYRLVANVNTLFRKAGDFISSTWVKYAEALEDYLPDNRAEEIKALTSTLFTFKGDVPYTKSGKIVKWDLPHTQQTIVRFDEQKDTIQPQLLFYRGLQACKVQEGDSPSSLVNRTYPMASNYNYDVNKTKIGSYCLAWNHPDGLINVWHKDYINLRSTSSQVTLRFKLPNHILNELNLLRKIRCHNQVYILDEVEESTSNNDSIVIVKAYPVKTSFNG